MHGDAVAFGLEQMAGEGDAGGDPDTAVKWMPVTGALEREAQIQPRMGGFHEMTHGRRVEAQLGETEQAVGVDPGIRAANGFLDASAGFGRVLRYIAQSQKRASCEIA